MDTNREAFLSQQSGMSKIERYQWGLVDKPGSLQMISKHTLFIDEQYQRSVNEAKILALAAEWSWVACGALIVCERDGRYYVVDGQHRLVGARRRADIKEMPCIVFETNDVRKEAQGFLRANANRKPITSLEKYKALIMTGDDNAVFVDELITSCGRQAGTATNATGVRCLSVLLKLAKDDRVTLTKVWALIVRISDGGPMHEKIISSLVFIESRMPDGESITDRKWANRLLEIGHAKLMESTMRAAAFYAGGGPRVWAAGIVEQLNKGLRHKLSIRGIASADKK